MKVFEKLKDILYISVITLAFFILADLLLGRFYPKVYRPTKYGWKVTPHITKTYSRQDPPGNYREITIQYFDYGFKRWPAINIESPRVLIIGDSFTDMSFVSNGEEWYSYLEREFPNIAFYVFGGGGYGTLQEYMVLDDHIDRISPQAIIWQFCTNDYENNLYKLDRKKYPYNNHFVRPYLENGDIVYRLPLPFESLRKLSFSADQLLHRYDRKVQSDATDNLELYLQQRKAKLANLSPKEKQELAAETNEAIEVTKTLMQKVRSRVGEIPIHFFNACGNGKLTSDDEAVCKSGGFNCMDIIDIKHLEKTTGSKLTVKDGGHWNFEGNRLVGQQLAGYFKNTGGI